MRRWIGIVGWLCMAAPLFAQDVPPALRDWQDGGLHGNVIQAGADIA
ncbi:hypothetical protein [Dyella sp. M7H15-1]|nr:hypothetical protein [Dyella sp. M7H15-1]